MGDTERIVFGVFLCAAGVISAAFDIWKRKAFAALYSLALAALGVALLLKLWDHNTILGVMVALIGAQVLTGGIVARSAKMILAAIACVAAGACLVARLCTIVSVVGAFMAISGCWGLLQSARRRTTNSILFNGGTAAAGVGLIGVGFADWFHVLVFLGSVAALTGFARGGWRIPSTAN